MTRKSQADEDDDYMFLTSLLPSTKILGDFQRLELRIEFLSSVTRRIQIDKNLSLPFNSVPTASNSSCPPAPSPCAASLDSTHSTHTLQMSCIPQARNYCHFSLKFHSENLQRVPLLQTKNGLPFPSTQLRIYTLKNWEQMQQLCVCVCVCVNVCISVVYCSVVYLLLLLV
jgi:hypothetical protein